MSTKKKAKRCKAYKPREISRDPINEIFGGMSGVHAEHLQTVLLKNSFAFQELVQGRGTRDSFDRVVGAINVGNILTEQGVGNEFLGDVIAARDAMIEVGKRYHKLGRFVLTGDELKTLNEFFACHTAQLENVRSVDIERAANEVIRRVRHHINSTTVAAEVRKDAARAAQTTT